MSDARAGGEAADSRGAAPFLPDEPVPVRLMNTVWGDRSGVHDELRTVEDLRRWLSMNSELGLGGSGEGGPKEAAYESGEPAAYESGEPAAYETGGPAAYETGGPGGPGGPGEIAYDHGDLEQSDVDAFRMLRDALRRLAALITDDPRPRAASPTADVQRAVADVNRAVTLGVTWPQLDFNEGRLQRRATGTAAGRSKPAARKLSDIAAQAIDLFCGDERTRLRACQAPGCVLYFVKHHPRREWCCTACGNRVRAARHYQRHRS